MSIYGILNFGASCNGQEAESEPPYNIALFIYKASKCLHNAYNVIANPDIIGMKQSLTPCNHNRLLRRFAPRNDRKCNYAKLSPQDTVCLEFRL